MQDMKGDAGHNKVSSNIRLKSSWLNMVSVFVILEHLYYVWYVDVGANNNADTNIVLPSSRFCTQALHVHIVYEFSIRVFILYMMLQKELKYTTMMYTIQIKFTTVNGIFLIFRMKNFKVWYKIKENWFRPVTSTIKFFGIRSTVDKYLGRLTFNLLSYLTDVYVRSHVDPACSGWLSRQVFTNDKTSWVKSESKSMFRSV